MIIDFNEGISPELQPIDPKLIELFKYLSLILHLSNVPEEDIYIVWQLVGNAYLSGALKGTETILEKIEKNPNLMKGVPPSNVSD